jgi:hypothetical protein
MRAHGFTDAKVSFSDCTPAPDGTWRGRLIFKAWGKKRISTVFSRILSLARSIASVHSGLVMAQGGIRPKMGVLIFQSQGLRVAFMISKPA